jgi:hypothetical protein
VYVDIGKMRDLTVKVAGISDYQRFISLKKITWTMSTGRWTEGLGSVHGSTMDRDSYPFLGVDVSYAAPQAHEIVNVALHREYYPGIIFIIS